MSLVPDILTINFAAASALNVQVRGTDDGTGESFVFMGDENDITSIVANLPGSDSKGWIILKRGRTELRRWPFTVLAANVQAIQVKGFPLGLVPGNVQFYIEFTAGTFTACSADIFLDHPPVAVSV